MKVAIGDKYRHDTMGDFEVEWACRDIACGDTVGLSGHGWTWTGSVEDMADAGFRPAQGKKQEES